MEQTSISNIKSTIWGIVALIALSTSAFAETTTTYTSTITSLSPSTCAAGSPGFTLTVNGAGFVATSTAYIGHTLLATTVVSDTKLTASVPAASVANAGNTSIGVTNGEGKGYAKPMSFAVTAAAPANPTISSISPTTCAAGSAAFTLTMTGTNYTSASTIYFGNALVPTTHVSTTQLTAVIPASAVAKAGDSQVGVTNGDSSKHPDPVRFTITAASTTGGGTEGNGPTLTSLSPTTCVAGSPDFTLTVTGTGFASSSTVYFGTKLLTTTFVSSTQLTALVPAVTVAKAGSLTCAVTNGEGKGHSGAANFKVTAGTTTPTAPTLTGLSPSSIQAGSQGFTLTVTGTNFTATYAVCFGTRKLATTFVSTTQLTAQVPADAVAKAGDNNVCVKDGDLHSGTEDFTVTQPANTAPTITSMSPTGCAAGSPDFTLTVGGTNFVSTSTIYLGSKLLTTTFVSDTKLTATVPAATVAKAGKLTCAVTNGEGKDHSDAVSFNVWANTVAAPKITTIAPTGCLVGSADLTLTVNGTGFTGTSAVSFGATALATTFVSATQLTATIPAAQVAAAGEFKVSVSGGDNGSNKVTFVVRSATTARIVYMSGKAGTIGNDSLGVLYTFAATSTPDFTQPVSVSLVNPATDTAGAATVMNLSDMILTTTTRTMDKGQVTVEQFQTASLLLTITPLPSNQYCLQAEATGLDLRTIDQIRPVVITVTIGNQTYTTQVQPYTLHH